MQEDMGLDPLERSVPEISNYRNDLEQGGSGNKYPDTLRKNQKPFVGGRPKLP